MDHPSEGEDTDISESELEDFSASIFEKLKEEAYEFKFLDGSFRCPFCVKKKKKTFKHPDIVQHAKGIAASNKNLKQVACHQAFAKFLTIDLASELSQSKSNLVATHDPMSSNTMAIEDEEVVYVWPPMGIIVNIPTISNNGFLIGETGTKLRKKYSQFNPVRVHDLWNFKGHTGNAIVEFRKDWSGFEDALNFSRYFEAKHHGRKQRQECGNMSNEFFGWIAIDGDYKIPGIIGDHLRRNGDLRTVSQRQQEVERKEAQLVSSLTNQITKQEKNFENLQSELQKTSESLTAIVEEKDKQDKIHNEEMNKLQIEERNHLKRISEDYENLKMDVDRRKQELELRSQDLDKMASDWNEQKRIEEEKKKNAATNRLLQVESLMQQKLKDILRLEEEHKKVKKQARDEMVEREKGLYAKHKLELAIQQLKGQLEVQQLTEDVDDSNNKIEKMIAELKDKEESMEALEENNRDLLKQEQNNKIQVEMARKRLIDGLREMSTSGSGNIGVKRMGEIDSKPFQAACNIRFPADEATIKALEMCSLWQDVYLKDHHWHPFKEVQGESGEIIDENDERLKELRAEWGCEVYQAVATALVEINKYNPVGRSCVDEIWNYKENRRALLREGIEYVIKKAFPKKNN